MRRQSGEGIGKPSKQHEITRWGNREAGQIGKAGTRTEPPRYRNRETSQDIETIKTLQSKNRRPRNRGNQAAEANRMAWGKSEPHRMTSRAVIANDRQRESGTVRQEASRPLLSPQPQIDSNRLIPRPGAGEQFKQAGKKELARGGRAERKREDHLIPSHQHCLMR